VKLIISPNEVTSDTNRVAWALKAMTLTDLTTLAGDDCKSNVERLCVRAAYPFLKHSISNDSDDEFLQKMHTAAVCVYPTKVSDAHSTLKRLNMLDKIQIAAGNSIIIFA
jgi:deoxyribose-phosphate aldolase